jgi:hypothetical protein
MDFLGGFPGLKGCLLWMPLDYSQGVVNRHLCIEMLFGTSSLLARAQGAYRLPSLTERNSPVST